MNCKGIKRSCSSEPGNNKRSGEAFNTKNRHSKDNKTKPPEQGRSGKMEALNRRNKSWPQFGVIDNKTGNVLLWTKYI